MTETGAPRMGRLIGLIAVFVLLGTPMVAYLWETLNVLLSGRVEPGRLAISVVVLALFAGLLAVLARAIHAVEGTRDTLPGANPPGAGAPPHSPSRTPS